MRIEIHDNTVSLWLSPRDTYNWAHKQGAWWPCSFLVGKRLFAQFDSGGLTEFRVNGGRNAREQDCPSDEFNAITSDHLRLKLPETHPAYFAAVGQFQR